MATVYLAEDLKHDRRRYFTDSGRVMPSFFIR